MDYGEKISKLRKSKGMTQEELGKVLNVTYQAVSKWERGESLPDFTTMSQIARYFEVPISYFEDGDSVPESVNANAVNFIGTCTECGKLVKEDEAFSTSPKIICNDCAERLRQEELRKISRQEADLKRIRDNERGGGFDVKLIISLILTLAGYIAFTVLSFTCDTSDRDFMGVLLLLVPLCIFGCTGAVFDLIDDFRDKDDGPDGYTRNLSLIIGAVFTAVNLALFLTLYFMFDKSVIHLVFMVVGAVISFTFISQMMWGSVLQDIFTCGGFTFKIPGVIFSLTPDSIILMIIVKIFLGFLSIIVFIITTVLFALVAIFGSVITFIPSVIIKTVKDKNA